MVLWEFGGREAGYQYWQRGHCEAAGPGSQNSGRLVDRVGWGVISLVVVSVVFTEVWLRER